MFSVSSKEGRGEQVRIPPRCVHKLTMGLYPGSKLVMGRSQTYLRPARAQDNETVFH